MPFSFLFVLSDEAILLWGEASAPFLYYLSSFFIKFLFKKEEEMGKFWLPQLNCLFSRMRNVSNHAVLDGPVTFPTSVKKSQLEYYNLYKKNKIKHEMDNRTVAGLDHHQRWTWNFHKGNKEGGSKTGGISASFTSLDYLVLCVSGQNLKTIHFLLKKKIK